MRDFTRARAYARRHWNIDLKNEWKKGKREKERKIRKGNLEVRARGHSRYENKYSLCMLMHEEWNSRRCLSVGNSSFSIGLGSGWSELAFNERGWTSSRLVAAVVGRGHANESNRRYRNLVPNLALYATIIEGAAPRSILPVPKSRYRREGGGGGVSPTIYVRPNLPRQFIRFLGLDSLEELHGGGRSLQDFPRILSRVTANAVPCQRRGEEREREREILSRVCLAFSSSGFAFSSRKDTRWNYIRSPRDIGRGEEEEEDSEETDG